MSGVKIHPGNVRAGRGQPEHRAQHRVAGVAGVQGAVRVHRWHHRTGEHRHLRQAVRGFGTRVRARLREGLMKRIGLGGARAGLLGGRLCPNQRWCSRRRRGRLRHSHVVAAIGDGRTDPAGRRAHLRHPSDHAYAGTTERRRLLATDQAERADDGRGRRPAGAQDHRRRPRRLVDVGGHRRCRRTARRSCAACRRRSRSPRHSSIRRPRSGSTPMT